MRTSASKAGTRLCATAVFLVVLNPPVRGDATVWTNGLGEGGATIRIRDPGQAPQTSTFMSAGGGESGFAAGNDAFVEFAWGPGMWIYVMGYACRGGASYGAGGAASLYTVSSLDLTGQATTSPPKPGALHLAGEVWAYGHVVGEDAQVHFAVVLAHPSVIPEGFSGTVETLIDAGIISAEDVVTRFSASNNVFEPIDEVLFAFDLEYTTLLVWTHGTYSIPAVSEWGLVALTLVLLTAATIVLRRRPVPA